MPVSFYDISSFGTYSISGNTLELRLLHAVAKFDKHLYSENANADLRDDERLARECIDVRMLSAPKACSLADIQRVIVTRR
jgi:hypothetical protein